MNTTKLRVGLDCDDTINYWYKIYLQRFGTPKNDAEITRNVYKLRTDKDFWLNLPIYNRVNFIPELYCSKRINPKSWSKQWLRENGYPDRPFYQVLSQTTNKASRIKGRVDVFVDDSISNFIAMNKAGVPCLLMNTEYNQSWGPVGRIYSLDIEEIEDAYQIFKNDILPNFSCLIQKK